MCAACGLAMDSTLSRCSRRARLSSACTRYVKTLIWLSRRPLTALSGYQNRIRHLGGRRSLSDLSLGGDNSGRCWWSCGTACFASPPAESSTADLILRFAAYPIDTLRFRMQCEMKEGGAAGFCLMQQTARKMWTQGGIRSFYRGLFWGLVGQYPYSALDLTTFEYTKRWWIQKKERQGFSGRDAHPNAAMTAAIGGFSGGLGASLVWPLNLLRTCLQTDRTSLHPRQYKGIADVARQKWLQKGGWDCSRALPPTL